MRTNCSHTVPSTSPVESSARGRRFVGLGAAARTLLGTAALAFALSSPASATPPTPDLDFTAGPQDPEISVGDVSHLEGTGGDTVFVFTVELSFASDEIVTAKVLGVDGTAEEGPDFDGPAVNLIYAPGETSKSYEVSVVGDSDVEGDEVFAVMVEQIDGAEIGDTEAVGTIVDDDVDPGGADPGAEAPADPGLPPTTDESPTPTAQDGSVHSTPEQDAAAVESASSNSTTTQPSTTTTEADETGDAAFGAEVAPSTFGSNPDSGGSQRRALGWILIVLSAAGAVTAAAVTRGTR